MAALSPAMSAMSPAMAALSSAMSAMSPPMSALFQAMPALSPAMSALSALPLAVEGLDGWKISSSLSNFPLNYDEIDLVVEIVAEETEQIVAV